MQSSEILLSYKFIHYNLIIEKSRCNFLPLLILLVFKILFDLYLILLFLKQTYIKWSLHSSVHRRVESIVAANRSVVAVAVHLIHRGHIQTERAVRSSFITYSKGCAHWPLKTNYRLLNIAGDQYTPSRSSMHLLGFGGDIIVGCG